MPRISPRLSRIAHASHPHLAKLLPACRDLRSAQNELRWLREHAEAGVQCQSPTNQNGSLSHLVYRRARGEPLQYILGNEFFGDLEIKCRPGVLIPRPETASSVSYLVRLIAEQFAEQSSPSSLRVLDFCTGTGCIPLLFHDEFYKQPHLRRISLDIKGYDISPKAISLAYENLAFQWKGPENRHVRVGGSDETLSSRNESLRRMKFHLYDVLAAGAALNGRDFVGDHIKAQHYKKSRATSDETGLNAGIDRECDILISNPPYISPSDYMQTTARSVRKFEPKLALVPPCPNNSDPLSKRDERQGDLFYPLLLNLAQELSAKLVLLEVADMDQAKRVVSLVLGKTTWNVDVEIWRDEPVVDAAEEVMIDERAIQVVGEGNGRSVFIRKKAAGGWAC